MNFPGILGEQDFENLRNDRCFSDSCWEYYFQRREAFVIIESILRCSYTEAQCEAAVVPDQILKTDDVSGLHDLTKLCTKYMMF